MADSLTTEGILGMDFMKAYSCNIDVERDILTFKPGGKAVKLQQQASATTARIQSANVILTEPVKHVVKLRSWQDLNSSECRLTLG